MTYLAQTKGDRIQLPPAILEFVRAAGWLDVLVAIGEDNESLTLYPLPHPAAGEGFATKVEPDGGLRLNPELRKQVGLDGQSVMVRVEGDLVRVYLRRVFQTLGFRPN